MKLHRFYWPSTDLKQNFWISGHPMLHQWLKVLRFRPGQQIVLFNGFGQDRMYKVTTIQKDAVELVLVTDMKPRVPKNDIYLFWSLLKKDKNDWVLQKGTELGVSHFIPLLADRSEKTGFNKERAKTIVIEAAEQCGRSDIPTVRDAMPVANAIEQYKDKVTLYICEQDSDNQQIASKVVGVLVGPEGGWSDAEKQSFEEADIDHLHLHDFTLRAETAAISSVVKVLQ